MTLPMDILHTDPANAAKAINVMYILLLLAGLLKIVGIKGVPPVHAVLMHAAACDLFRLVAEQSYESLQVSMACFCCGY